MEAGQNDSGPTLYSIQYNFWQDCCYWAGLAEVPCTCRGGRGEDLAVTVSRVLNTSEEELLEGFSLRWGGEEVVFSPNFQPARLLYREPSVEEAALRREAGPSAVLVAGLEAP